MQTMAVPLHVYDVGLEVLSPVAIGSGENERLSPYVDYVHERKHIRLIDQKKLMVKLASDPILAEEYLRGIRKIDNNRSSFDLRDFIANQLKLDLDEVTSGRIESRVDKQKQHITRCISSNNRAFIPGSTLKGAIRTGVLVDWLVQSDSAQETYDDICDTVRLSDPAAIKRYGDLEVGRKCFGQIEDDQFRNLHVSDFHNGEEHNTFITTRLRTDCTLFEDNPDFIGTRGFRSSHGNKQNKKMRFQCEAIKPGSVYKGELRLHGRLIEGVVLEQEDEPNEKYFDFLRQNDLSQLLTKVNDFSRFIAEREMKILSENRQFSLAIKFYQYLHGQICSLPEYQSHTAIIRLGAGKTWFDNSIGLMYNEEYHEERELLCGLVGLAFANDNTRRTVKATSNFPKTRSFTELNGKPNEPFGWVKLTFTPRG